MPAAWCSSTMARRRNCASASFNLMFQVIRTSGRIYPSNPRHIATALRLTQDPGHNAKVLQGALALISPDRRPVAKTYVVTEGFVPLFALPDTSAKSVGKMTSDAVAHVYFGNQQLGPRGRRRPNTGGHGASLRAPRDEAMGAFRLQRRSTAVWRKPTPHSRAHMLVNRLNLA